MADPLLTATPDNLTLAPGESAQVTVAVDPASPYGTGTVTIPVDVPTPYDGTIEGDFAGIVPQGEHWHITGDVNLTGDLVVEGLCTAVPSFTLEGNRHQILVQHGGRLDWQGIPKSGWRYYNQPPDNWQAGDLLVIAPMVEGVYVPTEGLWTGEWETMVRPAHAPDITLQSGVVVAPEVANLTRSIQLRNLRRIHFHDGPGIQTLRHLAVLSSGTRGVLGDYPLHFHLCGESARGSLVEGVVIIDGQNHAFVPHGSHGITLRDDIAYRTFGNAYWWDRQEGVPANNTNDALWERCGAIQSFPSTAEGESNRLTGLSIGAGTGNVCIDCFATCVPGDPTEGGRQRSGFHWPERGSLQPWVFQRWRAHNNGHNGIFTWQNTKTDDHLIEDGLAWANGFSDVNHGAYTNVYTYRGMNLNSRIAVVQHAKTPHPEPQGAPLVKILTFEDIMTGGALLVPKHNSAEMQHQIHRSARYDRVIYQEEGLNSTRNIYEDCGLTPADFLLSGPIPTDLADILPEKPIRIAPGSVIEITEGGTLTHRWAAGDWS